MSEQEKIRWFSSKLIKRFMNDGEFETFVNSYDSSKLRTGPCSFTPPDPREIRAIRMYLSGKLSREKVFEAFGVKDNSSFNYKLGRVVNWLTAKGEDLYV